MIKQFNIDLHLHGRFSGGVSKNLAFSDLIEGAKKKGLDAIGSGDIFHEEWRKEVEKYYDNGDVKVFLTVEIEDAHRIHHLLIFRDFEEVDKIKNFFSKKSNFKDGRPKVFLPPKEIAKILKENDILFGPAHAFTPYVSIYARFLSVREAYGCLPDFLELGLSADTKMAQGISELKGLTFLSNSDAHSQHPFRLGREFNRMEMRTLDFPSLKKAIKENLVVLNVGLNPKEGKYHETACAKCGAHYSFLDAKNMNFRCLCGGSIKIGVKDRIQMIKEYLQSPIIGEIKRPPYLHIIPLQEIISLIYKKGILTKFVLTKYEEFIENFGNEIKILVDLPVEKVAEVDEKVAKVIGLFREDKISYVPGGGGIYGKPVLEGEEIKEQIIGRQKTLF
jgi:uncharacterized protein (TIGR00375 family)